MTSAFSSHESVSLDRSVDVQNGIDYNQVFNELQLQRCVKWIQEKQFKNVCLQLPDEFLSHSIEISVDLKSHLDSTVNVFILGDTSYGSCCVDEIAAAHVNSDSIIHFGHACLSRITRLPVLYIFPIFEFSSEHFVAALNGLILDKSEQISLFYDVGYFHALDSLTEPLKNFQNLEIVKLSLDVEPDILSWSYKNENIENTTCIFIGKDNQTFFNLTMSLKSKKWILYKPEINEITETSPMSTNWLKRRYFYIEKCKDAQTIGIVVGTLTTKGYLEIVKEIQDIAKKRGIRSYLISVGKVNPSKLANFMEIDCFVLVGCPENNIYNSKDYFRPLVSVFEIQMALNPAWSDELPGNYSTDFREFLSDGKLYRNPDDGEIKENDVSLVTGKMRMGKINIDTEMVEISTDLMEKGRNELAITSSRGDFEGRSWKGLEPALGQNMPSVIEKGRSGIAISYSEDAMEN